MRVDVLVMAMEEEAAQASYERLVRGQTIQRRPDAGQPFGMEPLTPLPRNGEMLGPGVMRGRVEGERVDLCPQAHSRTPRLSTSEAVGYRQATGFRRGLGLASEGSKPG